MHAQPQRATASAGEDGPDGSRAVWEALAALSEGDREVLLLIAWEDLAPARAAQVLGIGANTFAVRLYRARRRLRHALAATSNDPNQRSTATEVAR